MDQAFDEILRVAESLGTFINGGELVDFFKQLESMIISVGVSQGYFTLSENPHYQKLRDLIEQICSKLKSEDLTQHLHDVSLHVNHL
jgi:hypothetical protein